MRRSERVTPSAARIRLSSAKTRSCATCADARGLLAGEVARRGSGSSPSSAARRTSRTARSGSSANVRGPTARNRRAARSAAPPCGSTSSPPSSGCAIALTVKSRSARSASSDPPRSGLRSACHDRSAAITRHAPNSSESSNAGPRAARASRRAAAPTSPSTTRSRSAVGRSSSRSRTAPPTSQASMPASASRVVATGSLTAPRGRRSRPAPQPRAVRRQDTPDAVAVVLARHARQQAAGDLVVDRVEAQRDLLGRDPLVALDAEQDGLVADRRRGGRADVERDVVHAHGPDERVPLAAHEHVGVVRQRAAHAVSVPDRQRRDVRRLARDEAPAVADALARRDGLDRADVRRQLERGLEVAQRGILAERVQAVDRDPGAHEIEVRRRVAQRAGAVGRVDDERRVRLAQRPDPCGEARELLVHERVAAVVGGREVRHRAGEAHAGRACGQLGHGGRLGGVARAEAAHPGVELDVHGAAPARRDGRDEALVPRDDVGARRERDVELRRRQRAHDEDRDLVDARRPQRRGLVRGDDGQPARAAGERRARRRHRAVAVAVGLDDRAQRRAGRELAAQARDVALDRGDVDASDGTDRHDGSLRPRLGRERTV